MGESAHPASIYEEKQKRGYDDEDRISKLPDDILVYILSLLTMEEAARTSVISFRWKILWTYIPCLNFDASKTLDEIELGKESLEIERPKYVYWVNQIVMSYQGPSLDKIRIRFDLNKNYSFDITSWLNFALEKKVKQFELDLSDNTGIIQNKPYTFPRICSNMRRLRTRHLVLSSCNSLKILRLNCVNVAGEAIEYFISHCPLLEQLYVGGSDFLVDLKVSGPSLKLKCLEICYCFCVKSIEISATNLKSFKYIGPKISMPFKNVPQLVELCIGGEYSDSLNYSCHQLSSYLCQLESLTLCTQYYEGRTDFQIPMLYNLRHLTFRVSALDGESILGFTSFIKASPFLYEFKLELEWVPGNRRGTPQRAGGCSHQCLKVVEILGFVGRTIDVELAEYLIESAVALEKITFDTRVPLLMGSPWESKETKSRRAARKRARKLGRKLALETNIVII